MDHALMSTRLPIHAPNPVQSPDASLPDAFRHGLSRGELVAHFQPQTCVATGRVLGFEALARWNHPKQGLLGPGQFLQMAQEHGFDTAISETMITQSMEALIAWGRGGHFIQDVSVNLSRESLENPALIDQLKWKLDRHDLLPQQLRVEVLESIHVHGADDPVIATVQRLAAMGINIDLDDFGTGSTSINGLRVLNVSRVKIDRSFVHDVDTDPGKRDLVRAIIALAQALRIDVLAEGVETSQELATLKRMGCTLVQGYHIAKPMPFAETLAWLDARNSAGAPERTARQRLERRA